MTQFAWDHASPFILEKRVGPDVIDGLQHVNNAAYVAWCEEVAWQHSESLGVSLADYQELDRAMAIRHSEYDYILSAYEGEELRIGTWLMASDGRLSMERHFQIVRASDGAVLLRGVWQLVCIQISSGKPRRMPKEFLGAYTPAVVAE